jgi:hypothetical protein
VNHVQIFFEGNSSLKLSLLRFIEKAAPASRGSIRIKLVKNKDETIKDFLRTFAENPTLNMILLVDSDAPDDGTLVDKLKKTSIWRKHAPKRVKPECLHWMVEVMESWFVADGTALKTYYGKDFKPTALPKHKNVEEVPTANVLKALKRASSGRYDETAKTTHAPKILDLLSPATVRDKAVNCDRFLTAVASLIPKQ